MSVFSRLRVRSRSGPRANSAAMKSVTPASARPAICAATASSSPTMATSAGRPRLPGRASRGRTAAARRWRTPWPRSARAAAGSPVTQTGRLHTMRGLGGQRHRLRPRSPGPRSRGRWRARSSTAPCRRSARRPAASIRGASAASSTGTRPALGTDRPMCALSVLAVDADRGAVQQRQQDRQVLAHVPGGPVEAVPVHVLDDDLVRQPDAERQPAGPAASAAVSACWASTAGCRG